MRAVRLLARLLLALYPPGFRRGWSGRFVEAAEHRLRLERGRGRRGAALRTVAVLVADTARAAPAAWREELRWGRSGGASWGNGTGGGGMAGWAEGWIWDLRIALRGLVRRPAAGALVAGTLAVGIGANAAVFGILDRTILDPLRFEGGERVVYVVDRDLERGFSLAPTQEELDRWREAARTVEVLETFQESSALLTRGGAAERVAVTRVSLGLPEMVGAGPVAGRGFLPEDAEPGAPPVAMIHEDAWRGRFGADPSVVGSTVTLSDEPVVVVGVWPGDVRVQVDADPAFFTVLPRGAEMNRSNFGIVLARMAPGFGPADVRSELRALQAGLGEEERSDTYPADVVAPHTFLGADFVRGLWILYGGVGLLLLVAVANAAGLLLNRAVDREAEIGVRLALGGGMARLLRQLLLEGGLLAAAGAAAGLALARGMTAALMPLAPERLPGGVVEGIDPRTAAYALALAFGVTLACGLVPAWHLRAPGVRRLLAGRSGGRGRSQGRIGGVLVAAQVALAVVLTAGGVLTVRSLARLASVEPGFAVREILMVTVRAPESRFPAEADRRDAYERVRERLAALPGVRSAAATGVLPFRYSIRFGEPVPEGVDAPGAEGTITRTGSTTPGFLETMGIPLLAGRDFLPEERSAGGDARVVLVSESWADRWPGDVLGRSLRFPSDTAGWRVVGVVGEVRSGGLDEAAAERPEVYYPSDGTATDAQHRFVVRAPDPDALVAAARSAVASVDPDLVVAGVETGRRMVAGQTEDGRFLAVLLAVLAGLSLSLALAGVFGAVSLAVSRRTREIGIRRALGAGAARLVGGVLREGLAPVVAGAAAGTIAAAMLARLVQGALYEVSPGDPLSLAMALVGPLLAAAAACLVPARRALRVEPADTLRQE